MPDALHIDRTVLRPAMELLPSRMDSPQSRVMLLTICGQEADFHHRWQVIDRARPEVRGPARGLFQFERGGGVRGVLNHAASRSLAIDVCRERGVEPTIGAVFERLESDDVLAACFARLLLWTDPAPLPPVGAPLLAWQLYLRTWRPGAYTRGSQAKRNGLVREWHGYYAQAVEAVVAPDFSRVRGGMSTTARVVGKGAGDGHPDREDC